MKFLHKSSSMLLHRIIRMKRIFITGWRSDHRITNHHIAVDYGYRLSALNQSVKQVTELENQSEIPHYPPIVDMSEEGQKKHFRKMWYDSIKALPTVEEKLHELAVQQKLDLKTYTLSAAPPMYTAVDFHSYITRTHTIDNLPQQFTDMNVDQELSEIRDTLCDALLNHYCSIWKPQNFRNIHEYHIQTSAGSVLANSLILQCYKKLALRNDYVFNSTIQQKPRIFSCWWHGGFGSDEDEVDEKNPCFQYEDYGSFAIRVKHPLSPILDRNHNFCSTAETNNHNFHPDTFHIPSQTSSKVAMIPGYWPGDPYEYPFLLVLTTDKLKSLTSQLKYFAQSKVETGAAVLSTFAWLNAIATYQGFTPFHDITYPLVCQTIITNGRDWNFFIYQLNTVAFHNDVDQKDRRNLCWSSGRLRLFDTIEDGQIKGINDEVFKVLLKFLHNVPQERKNVNMKPYLGEDTRTANEKKYMRYLLRKMYSRAPLKFAHRDEVPTWVKIYKLHPDAPPSPYIKLE